MSVRDEYQPNGRVTNDDLATAAMWLEANNGEEGEAQRCWRVADMLKRELERRAEQATSAAAIKEIAASRGVKPAVIRKQLRKVREARRANPQS